MRLHGAGRSPRRLELPREPDPRYPLAPADELGNSRPLSTRLPSWLWLQIVDEADEMGISIAALVRQLIEEWWVEREFPALEFRDPDVLRTACIRGGPSIRAWTEQRPGDAEPLAPEVERQVRDYLTLFGGRIRPSGPWRPDL